MNKTLLELAREATPGPWLAAASPSSVVGWPIVSPTAQGRTICSVNYVQHSKTDPPVSGDRSFNSESRANATFIAAANPQRIIELCEALERLIQKLDAVHADPKYMTVWQIAQLHQGPYTGPNYVDELDRARAVLKGE